MSLKIIKAGVFDTIQDGGRNGYRHLGINSSGAMDRYSAQLANALLGKRLGAPVVEMHFPAPVLLFEKATIACLSGGDFTAVIGDTPLPLNQPFLVPRNSVLRFNGLNSGSICYLSLLHEVQVDEWLQSTSTNLKAGAGGWQGRRFKNKDCIPIKENSDLELRTTKKEVTLLHWKIPAPEADNHIACIKGHEWDRLTPQAQWNFQYTDFTLSNVSDRMGFRLKGEGLTATMHDEMVSSAVAFGTVQLLPNGEVIVLMADCQTTGGYPRIAHVSSTALPSLAQVQPNKKVRFHFISLQEAENNWVQQQQYLQQIQNTCMLKIKNYLHALM